MMFIGVFFILGIWLGKSSKCDILSLNVGVRENIFFY